MDTASRYYEPENFVLLGAGDPNMTFCTPMDNKPIKQSEVSARYMRVINKGLRTGAIIRVVHPEQVGWIGAFDGFIIPDDEE